MGIESLAWIPAAILGVIGVILLLMLLYYSFAPTRRLNTPTPRRPEEPPQPAPPRRAPPPPPPTPAPKASPESTVLDAEEMQFVVINGPQIGQIIPLPGELFGIGRYHNPENNIQVAIDDKSISRNHALFRYNASTSEYFIQDVGSTYGTFLIQDGQPRKLMPNVEEHIYNHDIIQLGTTVQVQVTLPGDTSSALTRL